MCRLRRQGHGRWWLDRKLGSGKHYCQQCMHSIITPEAVDSGKKMLFAKWIDCSRVLVAVSPAAERVCMLRDTALINGIKKQGDVGKSQGECVGGAQ